MMSILFQYPLGFLWALLLLPFLAFLFVAIRHEREGWRAFHWPPTIKFAFSEVMLGTGTFVFCAVALAQPIVLSSHVERLTLPSCGAVLFVFDIGKSMAAGETYKPHRLDRARMMSQDVVDRFEGRMGVAALSNLISLHLFPTQDRSALKAVLNDVVIVGSVPFSSPRGSTSLLPIADAVPEPRGEDPEAGERNRDDEGGDQGFFLDDACTKILVVFSDGDVSDAPDRLGNVAEKIRKAGVKFIAVGVGREGELIPQYDEEGRFVSFDTNIVHFNETTLKKFASDAQGIYLSEKEGGRLLSTIRDFSESGSEMLEVAEIRRVARDLTPVALFGAVVFGGLFLFSRLAHISSRRM